MTEKKETDAKQATKKNLNQGHRSRMRKRYLTCGFSGFQEHEILELLLFYALPRVIGSIFPTVWDWQVFWMQTPWNCKKFPVFGSRQPYF